MRRVQKTPLRKKRINKRVEISDEEVTPKKTIRASKKSSLTKKSTSLYQIQCSGATKQYTRCKNIKSLDKKPSKRDTFFCMYHNDQENNPPENYENIEDMSVDSIARKFKKLNINEYSKIKCVSSTSKLNKKQIGQLNRLSAQLFENTKRFKWEFLDSKELYFQHFQNKSFTLYYFFVDGKKNGGIALTSSFGKSDNDIFATIEDGEFIINQTYKKKSKLLQQISDLHQQFIQEETKRIKDDYENYLKKKEMRGSKKKSIGSKKKSSTTTKTKKKSSTTTRKPKRKTVVDDDDFSDEEEEEQTQVLKRSRKNKSSKKPIDDDDDLLDSDDDSETYD